MKRHAILGSLLTLVALGATPAASADTESGRWYLGGSYGASSLNHDVADFSDGSISNAAIDDSDTGWKVFGGLRLREHLSIELSYVDLNNDVDNETTFSGSSDGSGTEFSEGPVSIDIDEPRAVAVALVGTLPFTDRATGLVKLGAAAWEADRTTFHQSTRSTESESGVDVTFGAGFQYRVGSRTALRLEWERYAGVSGDDIDLASVGITIALGRSSR